MTGDPVEESGQAMRMGFVQALQTAHTTAALLQRRGGESRSRAEHEQRLSTDAAREQRSQVEHWMRVSDAMTKARQGNELHQAKLKEVNARIRRGRELHDLEVDYKQAQIDRGEQDLDRRNTDSVLERGRRDKLHELDVEYKKLLIEIRRRAAGFSDTLSDNGQTGAAATATAAFAAAQASSDLSDAHRAAADAYAERVADDTGLDVGALIDEAFPTEPPKQTPTMSGTELLDRLNALTDQLTMALHLRQTVAEPAHEPAPKSEGLVIDAEIVEIADADTADADPADEPAVTQATTPTPPPVLELE
ncbi:hypothetical protein [Nocardia cyriacigeorgica]|uniref:hypothetical protein n=1 Tax=Nocardia cyriacigeorgica TaxID=135487 RepID=UPI00131A404F|nr:hypothetical protein [Nocardia cyriacigeorgica]